ncbi:hypothetical protein [Holospora curviuscula]|uniref:hypothetical protein n=1 Tax=Holospora curviuscula TaxID=1082868 RepID=UPI0013FD3672|nr:hypothetical protein [Holospora curviuscula]
MYKKRDELHRKEKQSAYSDERGFVHDMPRTHGYSVKGQRCYGKQDWGGVPKIE